MKHNLHSLKQLFSAILLLALLGLPGVGWGQTTIHTNACASATANWTYTNIGGIAIQQGGYWLLDAVGDAIISEAFDVTAYTALTLTFKVGTYGSGTNHSCLVEYSADNGSTWSTTTFTSATPTSSTMISAGTWNLGTISSSQLKFRWTSPSGGSQGVRIDDILLIGTPASSCTSLGTPSVTVTPGNGQATLTWDVVANVSSYSLIWNGGSPETVTSPVTKTGLTNGASYSYSLMAVGDGSTYCAANTPATGNVTPVAPPAPDAPVATAATTPGNTSFTANWNSVEGATGYRLDVYTKTAGAIATDLFISEYVEGSSNNKYIEIFNGTGASVDLSNYKLQLYANGSATTTNDVTLTGILNNGETIVYKNSSAALALPEGVTATNNASVNFNGDDAVALYKISTSSYVDIFGRIGNDPGTEWSGDGGYTTLDKTLVRKSSVSVGVTTNPTGTGATAFTTLTTEWDLFNIDYVTNLGSHTFVGGSTNTPVYSDVIVGNVTSYAVTGLTAATTYYYVVRAVNDYGTSANSNEISVTTPLPVYNLLGAEDAADNYTSWTNSSNEGCGFEAWALTSGGNAGFFLGDPSSGGISGLPNPSFALYANPAGSNYADADRAFVAPLNIGSTLSVTWGVNWDADGSGNKGISIYTGGTSGTQLININMGGTAAITINSNAMFNNYGTSAMTLNFEYVSAGNLRVYGTGRDGSESYDQTIAVAGAPDAIRFYASGLNTGDNRQPYFNNLKIVTDPSAIPAVSSVFVKGCVELAEDFEVEDLTIESGNTLQVKAGVDLTINGTLTNEAGASAFMLKSDATGTGSLIHNTAGVEATVERYIAGAAEAWHLLSSPVAAQAISGDFTPAGTYGDGSGYDFYAWSEPTETWLNQKVGANNITSFVPGKGYLVAYQAANPTKTFTGALNEGIYLAPLTISGSGEYKNTNLVGNPYPSSIDWKSSLGIDKGDLAGYGTTGVSHYIWNETASNYGVYSDANAGDDGTNGASRYIAPMQGFFVIAANAGDFGIDNDARVHSTQAWLKSGNENEFRLRVNAPASYGSDELLLEFGHNSSVGGAQKWNSLVSTAPGLFTTKEDANLSISYLSSVSENPMIPVAFKAGIDGNYSLTADFNTASFSSVILIDAKTSMTQNLNTNPVYSFNATTGDDLNRFTLHFGTLGITNPATSSSISVYTHGETLYIGGLEAKAEISVINLTGQVVMSSRTNGSGLHSLNAASLPKGVYVVSVISNGQAISRKVVL
jgi:hypothetical protein